MAAIVIVGLVGGLAVGSDDVPNQPEAAGAAHFHERRGNTSLTGPGASPRSPDKPAELTQEAPTNDKNHDKDNVTRSAELKDEAPSYLGPRSTTLSWENAGNRVWWC